MSFLFSKNKRVSTLKLLKELPDSILYKAILELWNAETPHFGGSGPHRYEGKSKNCVYCNRPKNWKNCNVGLLASELEDTRLK
jgi:hypothetical protein